MNLFKKKHIWRFEGGRRSRTSDCAATEEPLEIRINDRRYVVTMRTPGNDNELTTGLLFSEGFVRDLRDIRLIHHCSAHDSNIVNAALLKNPKFRQRHTATSACGICGKDSIDSVKMHVPVLSSPVRVRRSFVLSLPAKMELQQKVFQATGGLHAAALFGLDGKCVAIREDIGRHNAVDKIVGYLLLRDMLPMCDGILTVSGRGGFEIVQKAARAGIPIVCAVSAPSSLAIELARNVNMTLVGMIRGRKFNVYSSPHRIM